MNMNQPETENFLALKLFTALERKLKAFEAFSAATNALRTLIEQKQTAGMEQIIGGRQACIRIIDKANLECKSIYTEMLRCQVPLSEEMESAINHLAARIKSIIKELVKADHECRSMFSTLLEKQRCEVSDIIEKKQHFQSFYAAASRVPRFLDVKT